jgi:hypothetical protein
LRFFENIMKRINKAVPLHAMEAHGGERREEV